MWKVWFSFKWEEFPNEKWKQTGKPNWLSAWPPLIFNRFYSQRDKLALFYNFLEKNNFATSWISSFWWEPVISGQCLTRGKICLYYVCILWVLPIYVMCSTQSTYNNKYTVLFIAASMQPTDSHRRLLLIWTKPWDSQPQINHDLTKIMLWIASQFVLFPVNSLSLYLLCDLLNY